MQKNSLSLFLISALFGIFSSGFLGFNQDAFAHTMGYKDQYAPDKWKLTLDDSDGYLGFHTDVSINLVGGDDDTKEGLPGDTDYKLKEEIPCDGTIKFDWIFDGEEVTEGSGPLYDPSGYLINGVFHQVTLNFGGEVQSGSEFVPVSEGDVFGFRIHSLDNIVGPGIFVELNNFEGPLCIGDLDDEAYLSKPSEQFMTLEKARNIATGINQHWPNWRSWVGSVASCTCKSSDVPDTWTLTVGGPILAIYHPDAAREYRSLPVTEYSIPNHLVAIHGQQCTYDEFHDLIAVFGNPSSGTPDFWSPETGLLTMNHHNVDVDTYEEFRDAGLPSEYHETWTPNGIHLNCPHFGKDIEKLLQLTIREYRFLYGHNQAGPLGEALFLLKDDKPENDKSVCGKLTAFIKLVNAPGNKSLQEEDRTKLTAETNKIMTNMGCK